MDIIRPIVAAGALLLFSIGASAGDFEASSFGQRYTARNCAWCHGVSGQGIATAPRLAGQKSEYIVRQMLDFRTHARDNPKSQQYMWAAVRYLNADIANEVAAYLAALAPQAANDGDAGLAAKGEAIYKDGDIAANVPSCVACHGPNAEGTGSIPRLGGLSHRYLRRRLEQWGQGYHVSAAAQMPSIATSLSNDNIESLSSYLSFVH